MNDRVAQPERRTIFRRLLAVICLAGFFSTRVSAHTPSETFLTLRVDGQRITGQWDIALRDLQHGLGLDQTNASVPSPAELGLRQQALALDTIARLVVRAGDDPLSLRVTDFQTTNRRAGEYAVVRFVTEVIPSKATNLEIHCGSLLKLDPQMRGLLRLEHRGKVIGATFSLEQPVFDFGLGGTESRWRLLLGFVEEGVWHIWKGFDHILFLLALLLPAVLRWQNGAWNGAPSFRSAFLNVIKIVTAFTVAHSITLVLATLQVITLPSRAVESAIAFSVLLAALNNVFSFFHGPSWSVAFGFGLVHGFGFANVLTDLGLPRGTLALALVGFNLGVEAGQVVIVSLFLPLAYRVRGSKVYQQLLLRGGSAAVALVAFIWMLERLFAFKWLPF